MSKSRENCRVNSTSVFEFISSQSSSRISKIHSAVKVHINWITGFGLSVVKLMASRRDSPEESISRLIEDIGDWRWVSCSCGCNVKIIIFRHEKVKSVKLPKSF